MKRLNKLSICIATVLLSAVAGLANAETFAVAGGTITAAKVGDDVTITATGIPATTLVHFQHQGVRPIAMNNGTGVLANVSENGARFQLRDAAGKWLLITPAGNGFKMDGVVQECKSYKGQCALEAKI